MRIVICDDHRLLAEALATAIVRAGHTVEAVAATPTDGVAAVDRTRPDVLLLDLSFPGTRTVVLTGSASVRSLWRALEIGVAGYLRKDERIDQMLTTLERCTRGEKVVDDVLMRRLERSLRERERSRTLSSDFTPRERAVADLLREGLNTTQIVARLGISHSTVRTHVRGILSKLDVHSRIEAVALLDDRSHWDDQAS